MNVMIECKRLGAAPAAPIFMFAAVAFSDEATRDDSDAVVSKFAATLSVPAQQAIGRRVAGPTRAMWERMESGIAVQLQYAMDSGTPLARSPERFRDWLAALPGGLVVWGNPGEVSTLNQLCADVFGVLVDELPWRAQRVRDYNIERAAQDESERISSIQNMALEDATAKALTAAAITRKERQ